MSSSQAPPSGESPPHADGGEDAGPSETKPKFPYRLPAKDKPIADQIASNYYWEAAATHRKYVGQLDSLRNLHKEYQIVEVYAAQAEMEAATDQWTSDEDYKVAELEREHKIKMAGKVSDFARQTEAYTPVKPFRHRDRPMLAPDPALCSALAMQCWRNRYYWGYGEYDTSWQTRLELE